MKRSYLLFLLVVVIFSFVGSTLAQREMPNRSDLIGASGDPDSFGRNVKFMGVVVSGTVFLDQTCDFSDELLPDDRCILLLPAGQVTPFDVRDIGRITLPANSSKDVLAFMATYTRNYQFWNLSGIVQPSAILKFNPYITIESAALNDPRAVDPTSGLPLNGKLDLSMSSATTVDRSLGVNERIREGSNYSRTCVNCFSNSFLVGNGLPQNVVDRMYHQPMTIRLNLKGTAKFVSDGFMSYAIRFFGD